MALVSVATSALVACAPRAPEVAPRAEPAPAALADVRAFDGEDVTAFVHARVVPMDAERILDDQTVVVRGDSIAYVGPAARAKLGARVHAIDARGAYLVPGLADMHAHADWSASLTFLVAAGVTTARSMWGSPAQLVWRAQIARGERIGPRLVVGSPMIDGAPPRFEGSHALVTEEDAVREADEDARLGYDFFKVNSLLGAPAYGALAREASRLGKPIAGHVPFAVGLGGVFAARQTTIEHLTGFFEALQKDDSPAKGKADSKTVYTAMPRFIDDARIPDIARRTKEAGAYNCVTLAVAERIRPASECADLARAPYLKWMPPEMIDGWKGERPFTAEEWAGMRMGDGLRRRITRALRDAGAPILAGTDFNNPWMVPGFSLHEELEALVAAGLTPYEALATATRVPAELLRAPTGVVREGAKADLVLLRANPLADVRATRARLGVMAAGRWRTDAELVALLDALVPTYAPRRDRLASRAWPPGEARRHFRVSQDGHEMGEERVAIATRGAHRTLSAELVSDGLDGVDYALVMEVDAGAWRATWRTKRPEGEGALDLAWANGALHVTGTLPVYGAIDATVPLASGLVIGPMATFFLGSEPASPAPAPSRPIDAVFLDLDMGFFLEPLAGTTRAGAPFSLGAKGRSIALEAKDTGADVEIARRAGTTRFAGDAR